MLVSILFLGIAFMACFCRTTAYPPGISPNSAMVDVSGHTRQIFRLQSCMMEVGETLNEVQERLKTERYPEMLPRISSFENPHMSTMKAESMLPVDDTGSPMKIRRSGSSFDGTAVQQNRNQRFSGSLEIALRRDESEIC